MKKYTVYLFLLLFGMVPELPAVDVPENLVQEFTLNNGMHFIVVERHQFPTISCVIFYDVGAADEPRGKTGMAHLLEHLMFKGTTEFGTVNWTKEKELFDEANWLTREWIHEYGKLKNMIVPDVLEEDLNYRENEKLKTVEEKIKQVLEQEREFIVKNEYWGTYDRHGGRRQNAFTSSDYTGYFVVLPANKLELWAIMDSSRMRDAVFREFFSERDVVMEEKRLRGESNPDSKLWRLIHSLAFNAHPYGRPVVGYWDDLYTMSYEDIYKYYDAYYKPNNSVAVIVGDVGLKEVKRLAKKYFEPIATGDIPERYRTFEPPMNGQRSGTVYADSQPKVAIAYRVPGYDHADFPALQLAARVLGSGNSSRLNRQLVLDKKIARSASSWCSIERDPYLFMFWGEPFKDHTVDEVEQVFREELEKLKLDGPSVRELQKVKNNLHASSIYRLDSPTWFAMWLARHYTLYSDWREGYRYLDRLDEVTVEDVKRVVGKYLIPENEIKGVMMRKEGI
jgi:predicted Zn-dependent peptidase